MPRTLSLTKIPRSLTAFLKEARQELKTVQWPSREDTIRATLVILIVSFVVAVATGAIDRLFTFLVKQYLL